MSGGWSASIPSASTPVERRRQRNSSIGGVGIAHGGALDRGKRAEVIVRRAAVADLVNAKWQKGLQSSEQNYHDPNSGCNGELHMLKWLQRGMAVYAEFLGSGEQSAAGAVDEIVMHHDQMIENTWNAEVIYEVPYPVYMETETTDGKTVLTLKDALTRYIKDSFTEQLDILSTEKTILFRSEKKNGWQTFTLEKLQPMTVKSMRGPLATYGYEDQARELGSAEEENVFKFCVEYNMEVVETVFVPKHKSSFCTLL